jgi:hypothetical protein
MAGSRAGLLFARFSKPGGSSAIHKTNPVEPANTGNIGRLLPLSARAMQTP